MKKGLHILLFVLGGIFVLAAIFALWFSQNYKPILHRKIHALAKQSSDSLYILDCADIELNMFRRRIELTDLHLDHDTLRVTQLEESQTMPNQLFSLSIPKIEIAGINWFTLLLRKKLVCSRLVLIDPGIGMNSVHDSMQTQRVVREISAPHVSAKHVEMIRPALTIVENRDSTFWETGDGSVILEDFALYPKVENDTTTLYYTITGAQLDSLLLRSNDGFYRFHTGNISYSESSGKCEVRNLQLKPAVSRQTFYARKGEQAEIYEMNFPSIIIHEPDMEGLLFADAIKAKSMRIADGKLEMYLSRVPPPTSKSKMGFFPNQLLLKQKIPIQIDSIAVLNGLVRYTELSYETRREGEILFTGIRGWISNVTNIPERIKDNHICVLDLEANTLGDADIKAKFEFLLDDNSGAFEVTGHQGPVDGRKTNEAARALSLAEFESFDVRDLDISVTGNQNGARGTVKILYDDLKVNLLKMEGMEMDDKKFATTVVETLFLYPQNPMPGEEPRVANVTWDRDPYKSFFNMIWKVLFSGALHTAMRGKIGEDITKKVLEKPGKKDAERRE